MIQFSVINKQMQFPSCSQTSS